MLNPTKTAAAAAFMGLIASPLVAQVDHMAMTCTDFRQSTPETQTEVVQAFIAEAAPATEMSDEELVSTILTSCNNDDAQDDTAHSKFVDATAG